MQLLYTRIVCDHVRDFWTLVSHLALMGLYPILYYYVSKCNFWKCQVCNVQVGLDMCRVCLRAEAPLVYCMHFADFFPHVSVQEVL